MDVSQNQTERYGLHLWEPGDDFLREEFNENFEALDRSTRVITGVYIGDGAACRSITLDFTPSAVLLMTADGQSYTSSNGFRYGGLALAEAPVVDSMYGYRYLVVSIEKDSFSAYENLAGKIHANQENARYFYLVFR